MSRQMHSAVRFVPLAIVVLAVLGLTLLTTQSAQANIRLGDGGQVPF